MDEEMSFLEKALYETKDLADGNKFFVYSLNFDVYSCNLCGVKRITDEYDLRFHDSSLMHTELKKLDKIPYKKWMLKDCIVDFLGTDFNPAEGFKSVFLKVCEETKPLKSAKKQVPRCYRQANSLSDSSDESEGDVNKSLNGKEGDEPPTFLTMCRQLTALEDFLEESLKDGIKSLFLKSVELERDLVGSSNSLLSLENLEFLFSVKTSLAEQLDAIPVKFLGLVNLFFDDMIHFTTQFARDSQNMKNKVEEKKDDSQNSLKEDEFIISFRDM